MLVLVSNLDRNSQEISVRLNLERLDLHDRELDVFDVLSEQSVPMEKDGTIGVSLGPEEWMYVWLRPEH